MFEEFTPSDFVEIIVSVLSGGTLTFFVQYWVNRKKQDAETVKVSAETLGIDVKNRQSIEEFYSGLLDKREGMVEEIYQKMLDLENRMMEQTKKEGKLLNYNAKLIQIMLANDLEIPPYEIDK